MRLAGLKQALRAECRRPVSSILFFVASSRETPLRWAHRKFWQDTLLQIS
jgi:hypothetical protein